MYMNLEVTRRVQVWIFRVRFLSLRVCSSVLERLKRQKPKSTNRRLRIQFFMKNKKQKLSGDHGQGNPWGITMEVPLVP